MRSLIGSFCLKSCVVVLGQEYWLQEMGRWPAGVVAVMVEAVPK